ncbi:MAG: siroheme synthase CysG [Gammaproteobacteria bacterium]|nr:siroheme synthase CysG [Gammaproteobacteria bacterium]
MNYLPLHIDVRGRDCLVVGGGALALRKIELLLRAGATVSVVAKTCCAEVRGLAGRGSVLLFERGYRSSDVNGRRLVIAATDDARLNRRIYADCETRETLMNAVDAPSACSAIFPAIVDRGAVQVSVSTGGGSPTLARIVRGWIEARLPPRLGALAEFAAERRERVAAALPDLGRRRAFWERVLNGPVAERLLTGAPARAETAFAQALAAPAEAALGLVALVGAGPGDPELLTLKALRLLQEADAVLYDNLVNERILDFARRDAERIYVGKRQRFAGLRQAAINDLLAERALAGQRVVRLKGGDPFIFGRGGEEVETLAAQGIDCVVVPGITAALGAASTLGIPLTHRDLAQSVRFVTGHRVNDQVNLDWPELINPHQTLVVYMGLLGLAEIVGKLIGQGMNPQTPALLIERATLPEQRQVQAPLRELPAAVAAAEVSGPTLIIIGEVINLRLSASGRRRD